LAELIPAEWEGARKRYLELAKAEERARNIYRNNSDSAYEVIKNLRGLIDSAPALQALESQLQGLEGVITAAITPELAEPAMDQIEAVERVLGDTGASSVKSALAKARRALKKEPDVEKAAKQLQQALARYQDELQWRQRAQGELATALANYDAMIKSNIGIRMQARLTVSQAEEIASCQSVHKDVSLHF
ncbi:MAG TPA: C4-dicarboxylate ABC transporter permease, partial [Motiliproteus sp.]